MFTQILNSRWWVTLCSITISFTILSHHLHIRFTFYPGLGPHFLKWDQRCQGSIVIKSWVSFAKLHVIFLLSIRLFFCYVVCYLFQLLYCIQLSLMYIFIWCRYILSSHKKVIWDVNIASITINVPWRNVIAEESNLVTPLHISLCFTRIASVFYYHRCSLFLMWDQAMQYWYFRSITLGYVHTYLLSYDVENFWVHVFRLLC